MADRILPTANHGSAPTPHAYNDPDLSPIEFLTAVYRATHLPMVSRIAAASALLPTRILSLVRSFLLAAR